MVGQLPGRQVVGQETPGAAGAQHVPDGVDDLPAQVLGGTSTKFSFWNPWFRKRPLPLVKYVG